MAVRLPALRLSAVALAVGLWMAMPSSASAGWVPRTELRIADQRQGGGMVWAEWTRRTGRYCTVMHGDGLGTYPDPLTVAPGQHAARFLLRSPRKPRRVSITAWRAADPWGNPIGPGEELPFELEARAAGDGTVRAWRAAFSVAPPPDYYLDLYVRWPAGKCGGPRHLLERFQLAAGP